MHLSNEMQLCVGKHEVKSLRYFQNFILSQKFPNVNTPLKFKDFDEFRNLIWKITKSSRSKQKNNKEKTKEKKLFQ